MTKVDFDWLDLSVLEGPFASPSDVLIKLNLTEDDGVEDSAGIGCAVRTYVLPDYEVVDDDDKPIEESVNLWVVWSLARYGVAGPSETEIRDAWAEMD